jgi:hypothetical protein
MSRFTNSTVSGAGFPRPWTVRAVLAVLLLLAGANTAHAAAATPALSFAAPVPFGARFGASTTAVADLNRDGVPDIAVVNAAFPGDETISVLLGNVSAPGTYLPKVDYTAAEGAWDLAIADMNRDGVLDIVVINCGCMGPMSIFFGLGDGTFAVREDYAVENLFSPYTLDIDDLNRDGLLDIAISDESFMSVAVLLGNVSAPGSFTPVQHNPVGVSPGGVRIGDFDRDGIPDIAVTNFGSDTISVLLGAGNGSFGSAIDYPTGPGPDALVVGDFNRDGLLDLATGTDDGSAHTISVLLGNVSAPGAFSAFTEYPVDSPFAFLGLVAADVNGDGVLDLAVVDQDTSVHVVTGNPDGSFNASEPFEAGDTPVGLAAADLDRDGRIDIVAGNPFDETVSVLFNTTTFAPSALAFTQTVLAVGEGPQSLAIGDFNRDGIPDVVTAEKSNGNSSVTVAFGAADGTFGSATPLPGPMASPVGVAVADMNRDGALDVLWMNAGDGTLSVALGNGDGTFQLPVVHDARARAASYLAVSDFNRDGVPDVVLSKRNVDRVSVLIGTGGNTSFVRTDYAAGDGARIVAVEDLNGDGAADIAVANYNGGTVSVLLNDGNGGFAGSVDYAMDAGPRGLALADLNRDGFADMVTANAASFSVRLGMGDGTFDDRMDATLPGAQNNVAVADMNRDGVPDLLFGGVSNGRVTVLYGAGDGTFTAGRAYAASSSRVYVAVADVDRDGRPDIVTGNTARRTTSVMLNRAAAFRFVSSAFAAGEGAAGSTVVIGVRRTGDTSTAMTVDFATSDGTATAGDDYTATSGTLTFGIGDALRTFPVSILADDAAEGPETVLLTLSNPSGDAGLTMRRTATIRIAASDQLLVQFDRASYVTSEAGGNRTITVTRTGDTATPVTVDYATSNGTARAGQDYVAAAGTLSFGAGETSQTFTVTIIDDTFTEGAQTINLTLSSPGGGAALGPRATAVLTINASD